MAVTVGGGGGGDEGGSAGLWVDDLSLSVSLALRAYYYDLAYVVPNRAVPAKIANFEVTTTPLNGVDTCVRAFVRSCSRPVHVLLCGG